MGSWKGWGQWALIIALLVWHGSAVMEHASAAVRIKGGNDFASYHYAYAVAADGGDPYDKAALADAAQAEGARQGVHPFFYPPPFLLGMGWTGGLGVHDAYLRWFWFDELCAVLVTSALAWSWRGLGRTAVFGVVGVAAVMTAIPNNHVMGQANLPVLLLVVLGLWAEARGRAWVGGALLGAACMAKMSPALFVAWWLLRGRRQAVAASVVTAVALTALSLMLVGPALQVRFYTEVLPTFSSGSYNGLTVGLNLFGNHSLPNLFDDLWPAGPKHLLLSSTAQAATVLSSLALVGLTAWRFWRPPRDGVETAAQLGAVAALMLLVPAITYEHHLVWLLMPGMAAIGAVSAGRLSRGWGIAVAIALAVACFDLAMMKTAWQGMREGWPVAAFLLRELKFASIVTLFAACLVAGRRGR